MGGLKRSRVSNSAHVVRRPLRPGHKSNLGATSTATTGLTASCPPREPRICSSAARSQASSNTFRCSRRLASKHPPHRALRGQWKSALPVRLLLLRLPRLPLALCANATDFAPPCSPKSFPHLSSKPKLILVQIASENPLSNPACSRIGSGSKEFYLNCAVQ
jgi:hypothetical protein